MTGQDPFRRGAIRLSLRAGVRPVVMAGLFAGFLAACTASSVLEPPSDVPTASISPSASLSPAIPPAPIGQAPGTPPAFVYGEPSYGAAGPPAPMAEVSALPSYDALRSGELTPSVPPAASQTPTAPVAAAPPAQMPVAVAPAAAAPVQVAPPPAAPVRSAPVQSAPPREEPRRLAGLLPRALNPMSRREAPQGGQGSLPAAERDCQDRLRRLGVQFTARSAVGNGQSCGIAHPVVVSGLSGGIQVSPATTLNCPMAEALALWVRRELAPGVRKRYLSGIRSIGSMGGYSCRTMNSRRGAPMSEHSRGNAMDIGSLTLNNGRTITISSKGIFAFRERGLLNSVRSSGCNYFTTILGPGSDANHADHFHFDLRARRNGYRHCD